MSFPTPPPGLLLILAGVSTGAVGLAWIMTLVFRRKSAALRHFVWSLAFIAPLLALPLALLHPRISLPVLPCSAEQAPARAVQSWDRLSSSSSGPARDQSSDWSGQRPQVSRIGDPAPSLNLWWSVWFLGAAFEMVRLCRGQLRLRHSVKGCAPGPGGLLVQLDAAKGFFGFRRQVRLLVNPSISVPICCGVFRPVIIFPRNWRHWDDERIVVCLTHEMAHIIRGDLVAMLAAHFACVLCWFNPLLRLAALKLRDEAENASDDLVLSRNIPPARYASNLVSITEECQSLNLAPAFALSVAPIARTNRLTPRVVAILDSTLYRKSPSLRMMLGIAAAAACALIASMSVRLTPAAFSGPADSSAPLSGITGYVYEPNPQKIKPKMYNWEVQLSAADSRRGPYEIIEVTSPGGANIQAADISAKVLIDPEMIVANANGVIDFMLYVGNKEPAPDPAAKGNIGEPIKFSGKGSGTGETNEIDLPGSEIDRVIPAGKGTQLTGGRLGLIQFIAVNGRGEKFRTDVLLARASDFPQLGTPGTVSKKPSSIGWQAGECANRLMLPGNYEASADGNGGYEIRCVSGPGSDDRHNVIRISFQSSDTINAAPVAWLRSSPLTIEGTQASWGIYRTVADGRPVIRKEVILPNFLPRHAEGHGADYIRVSIDAGSQEMIDKLTPVAGGILRDAR